VNSYYQSLLEQISKEIGENHFEAALQLIDEELSMPYVPAEIEKPLRDYRQICLEELPQPEKVPDLESLIQGNQSQQELAVMHLSKMNLRMYSNEVQTLLDSTYLLDEIKGELIESLMEQKIDTPYHIKKSGLEITFIPSAIRMTDEDDTVIQIQQLFDDWFSNDNPTFCRFCHRLLKQEILENRPFDFEELDPRAIAKSIVRLVSEAFGQLDEFTVFSEKKGLQDVAEQPLLIERRGEES